MFNGFTYNLSFFADVVVGFSWVIAYILCLIGSIKEKRPGFPPMGSVAILPWEFWAVVEFVSSKGIELNYVLVVRASFFIFQAAFFVVALYKLYKTEPKKILFRLFEASFLFELSSV